MPAMMPRRGSGRPNWAVGRGDDDVAGEDQAGAAGDGGAVDRGDDRLGELDHLRDDFAVGLGRVAQVLRFLGVGQRGGGLHFLQVHAGAEGGAGTGEDDRSDAFFEVQIAERFGELGEHRARERVAPLRAVEHDRADGAGYLHVDGVAGHEHRVRSGWLAVVPPSGGEPEAVSESGLAPCG